MTEEKKLRIMAAFAVNAVLLVVILMGVLIYQFVEIGLLSQRKKTMQTEIQEFYRLMQEDEDMIEQLQSEEYYEYYCIRHPDVVKAYLESLENGD